MNTPSDNQDPQTAIDYNLYPSSARPSWLVVPTPENPNVFGRTSDCPQGIKDLAEYVKLHELADRIGDITEDAHGNPKPLSLADRQEAASQLRELGAELAAFHAAMERERKPDWEKWHIDLADSLVHYSGPTPYTLQEAARELRSMATAYTDSKALMDYINENAALADKSSKEWGAAGDKVNEAYRSGMWHAYNDIRNRIPHTRNYKSPEEVAAIVAERDERRVVMADIVRILGHGCCGLGNGEIVPEISRQLTAHTQALKVARDRLGSCVLFLKDYLRGITHAGVSRMVSDCKDSIATINNLLK